MDKRLKVLNCLNTEALKRGIGAKEMAKQFRIETGIAFKRMFKYFSTKENDSEIEISSILLKYNNIRK